MQEGKEPDYIVKHYNMHDTEGIGKEAMEKLMLKKAGSFPKTLVNHEIMSNDMGTYPIYTIKALYKN